MNFLDKKTAMMIGAVFALVVAVVFGNNLVETNRKGYYKIKQAAVSGEMSVRMKPGMFPQLFGEIQEWPKAETFYFTSDADEGRQRDDSIEVRFNDGSVANISGTVRITMPTTEIIQHKTP